MDDNLSNYGSLAAKAEAAVGAVKDPGLRPIAFEKILEQLLEQGLSPSGPKSLNHKTKERSTSRQNEGQPKKSTGPKAYVEGLIEEGFFKEQRTIAQVKAELANRGRHIAITSLSGPLQSLTQERRLRRQKTSADGNGSKTTYAYSNW